MKIYGTGVLTYLGSSRVVWDFTDGPFDTYNPILIKAAESQGFSFNYPEISEPKDTPKKRGRKPKGEENVNA